MKALLTLVAVTGTALAVADYANAAPRCMATQGGISYLSEYRGTLQGPNFTARVRCSGYTPVILNWYGGRLCRGSGFQGRFMGRNFRCWVLTVGR